MTNLFQNLTSKVFKKGTKKTAIEEKIDVFLRQDSHAQSKEFSKIVDFIEEGFTNRVIDRKERLGHEIQLFKATATTILSTNPEKKINDDREKTFEKFIDILRQVDRKIEKSFLYEMNDQQEAEIRKQFRVVFSVVQSSTASDTNGTLKKNIVMATISIRSIVSKILRTIHENEKINRLQENFNKIAGYFETEATQHKKTARFFLVVSALWVALTTYYAYWSIKNPIKPNLAYLENSRPGYYVYLVIDTLLSGKLLMSAILIVTLIYFFRFYAASKHNSIVFYQRANTLKSFRPMYDNTNSSSESKEKELVLEKVLEASTSHQSTAFSKEQSYNGSNNVASLLANLLRWLKPSN